MTTQEVAALVSQIGLPYCYYQFNDDTERQPPFVAFFFPDETGLNADDVNYAREASLTIEFYSDAKDFTTEETIEALLDENDIPWEKDSVYLGSERMWMTTYSTSVLLTPSNPPTPAVTT